MTDQIIEEICDLPSLPTGKSHISFSELSTWLDCPFKHNLTYVKKLDTFTGSVHTDFGTHVHSSCENFLKTGIMDASIAVEGIKTTWSEKDYGEFDSWVTSAESILSELPDWMNKTFPGWVTVDAEHALFESLAHIDHADTSWKGYIDGVIKYAGKKDKEIIHILDWKTTSWGWTAQKLRDPKTNIQAAAYKIFWSRKFDMDMTNIRASYVLLKRTAKPGNRCQLIDVSVGDKTKDKVNESIRKMVHGVKTNHIPKNRLSCTYCVYAGTEHCPGSMTQK